MKSHSNESAIWAVDPFSRDLRSLESGRLALAAWEKAEPLAVRPVSILTPPPAAMVGPWESAYEEWTRKTLKPVMRRLPAGRVKAPFAIVAPEMFRSYSIDRLIKYAKKSKARIIVATTHARKGVGRSRMGGFTQTLIERSPIPVLTVRPGAKVPSSFKRMMFMTDFSAPSKRAYLRLLEIAESFGSKVILFHRLNLPDYPMTEYPVPMAAQGEVVAEMTAALERRWQAVADRWRELAEKRGLEAEVLFSRDLLALAGSVSRAAKKSKADLIALALNPHPVTRILLGSSVSEIIRTAAPPVLVFREK